MIVSLFDKCRARTSFEQRETAHTGKHVGQRHNNFGAKISRLLSVESDIALLWMLHNNMLCLYAG